MLEKAEAEKPANSQIANVDQHTQKPKDSGVEEGAEGSCGTAILIIRKIWLYGKQFDMDQPFPLKVSIEPWDRDLPLACRYKSICPIKINVSSLIQTTLRYLR